MTTSSGDLLHHWFDNAVVVALMFMNSHLSLRIKDYPVEYCPETYIRKREILKKSVAVMIRHGVVQTISEDEAVKRIMSDYNNGNVSLVELIYRAQFWLKEFSTKPEQLRMDWDEWRSILYKELGIKKSSQQLYGIIALCSFFDVPITVSLYCRLLGISEYDLIEAMSKWRVIKNLEPICFHEECRTLLPRHDIVAELFFLFHRDTLPINDLMVELLNAMNEFEVESFLEKVVRKGAIQKGYSFSIGKIRYRDYLMTIYQRIQNGTCSLSSSGRAQLSLGLLYTVPKRDRQLGEQTLPLVEALDPGLDGSILTVSLYIEWGRLLVDLGQQIAAEDKFRSVLNYSTANLPTRIELSRLLARQPGREKDAEQLLLELIQINPEDLVSRIELGRLLTKQTGREQEAEHILREALRTDPQNSQVHIALGRLLVKQPGREDEAELFFRSILRFDPDNIQSRTELGHLLSKQPGREAEAEQFLREAIRIDPKNLHPHAEMGRLLAKQPGRESEAEQFLREAIRIDPKNLHPHTELGRLLAKQPGKESEAEQFLREAMQIDSRHLHSRIELAKLCIQTGRSTEAERLYREVLRINPGDSYATEGLAGLRRLQEPAAP